MFLQAPNNGRGATQRGRVGFTLVELLVAMALIVFMMVILAEAFSVGLETFRRLKAIGDMNGRLRTVAVALRSDLLSDHFEGRRRVSDPNFWNYGPPQQGFFRIYHGSPLTVEDADAGGDQIPSTRAVNHILHLTVKKRGNERGDFFLAKAPTGSPLLLTGIRDARYQDTADVFTSQWAEVAYFLRPNGESAGTTPLYALYRRQRLLVPDDNELNRGATRVPAASWLDYLEISNLPQGGSLYFNGPMDITIPQRRLGMDPTQNGGVLPAAAGGFYPTLEETVTRNPGGDPNLGGADLLLTDVLSFEITVLLANGTQFVDLFDPTVQAFDNGNPRFPITGPRVFDTWTAYRDDTYDYSTWDLPGAWTTADGTAAGPARDPSVSLPLYRNAALEQIRITAVKVTLRVWDVKTLQTRQVSFIQDL